MPDNYLPNSIVIRSSFYHHAKHAGYKQILKYTQPKAIFGINENEPAPSIWKQKYQWLYEFEAYRYAKEHPIDLLHILYGEDYFRFSTFLLKKKPVIVTFHQPPEILQREIHYGDVRGKVGRLTHLITKNRFKNLSAAIVITEAQKAILSEVMSTDKIHVLSLGADLNTLLNKAKTMKKDRFAKKQILTVGNWQRDWDFYFEMLKFCSVKHPDWNFVLVCRNLPDQYKAMAPEHSNLFYKEFNDEELISFYTESRMQFLPIKGGAGNNSVMESLALGCPLVMTDIGTRSLEEENSFIHLHTKKSLESAEKEIEEFITVSGEGLEEISKKMLKYALNFDWSVIGAKTLEIYKSVL